MLIEKEENVASRCGAVVERMHAGQRREQADLREAWKRKGDGGCKVWALAWSAAACSGYLLKLFFQLRLGIHTLTWCNFLPVFSCTAYVYALHRGSRFICLLFGPQTDWENASGLYLFVSILLGKFDSGGWPEAPPAAMALWGRTSPSSGALSSFTRCCLGGRISQRESEPFLSSNRLPFLFRKWMFAILKGIILPPFVLHDGSVCPRLSLEGPTFPGAPPAPLSAVSPPVGHSCLDDKIRGSRARIFSL